MSKAVAIILLATAFYYAGMAVFYNYYYQPLGTWIATGFSLLFGLWSAKLWRKSYA